MVNQANNIPCCEAAIPRPFLPRLAALWRRHRQRVEHRRAMARLLTVEDRLLSDIGLDRATVAGHYDDPALGIRPDRR